MKKRKGIEINVSLGPDELDALAVILDRLHYHDLEQARGKAMRLGAESVSKKVARARFDYLSLTKKKEG